MRIKSVPPNQISGRLKRAAKRTAEGPQPADRIGEHNEPHDQFGDGPLATASTRGGKLSAIVECLQRPTGATITELIEVTGWQAHSVRGAIAGAIKKKLGLSVVSEKTDAGRRYRIEAVSAFL